MYKLETRVYKKIYFQNFLLVCTLFKGSIVFSAGFPSGAVKNLERDLAIISAVGILAGILFVYYLFKKFKKKWLWLLTPLTSIISALIIFILALLYPW